LFELKTDSGKSDYLHTITQSFIDGRKVISDADGILDYADPSPLVITAIVVDSDGDGLVDDKDAYPNDATRQYQGSSDLDQDGFTNDEEVDYCSNPFDPKSQPIVNGISPALMKVLIDKQEMGN